MMKLLIVQFHLSPCPFFPLSSKHPQSVFSPYRDRPNFTHSKPLNVSDLTYCQTGCSYADNPCVTCPEQCCSTLMLTDFSDQTFDVGSQNSSVSIVTKLQAGRSGIQILAGKRGFFSCLKHSKLALGPTQSPIQWVSGAISPYKKWLGHEANLCLAPE